MSRQSELKCQKCVEWYDEGTKTPKQLPCGHNLCATCVLNLLGEPLHGPVNLEPVFPSGRMMRCPVCQRDVSSDQTHTNRVLARKISGLIGLESMIIGDDELKEPKSPKPNPSTVKNKPTLPAKSPHPQQAQPLGWTKPNTSPVSEVPVIQQENNQSHIGWTLPGVPVPSAPASVLGMSEPYYETPFCPQPSAQGSPFAPPTYFHLK
ncbi:uncharacterized protein LOC135218655 [Macrobrachium nipponense]|uniref:uncharacterized protein LOC135218655 n=1 Tax=Macrobrachium nipponense TaxID=159736 RepID=UPI0030C8B8F6